MEESLQLLRLLHHSMVILSVAILALASSPNLIAADRALLAGLTQLRTNLSAPAEKLSQSEWVEQRLRQTQTGLLLTSVVGDLGIVVDREKTRIANLVALDLRTDYLGSSAGPPPTLIELSALLHHPPRAPAFDFARLGVDIRPLLAPYEKTAAALTGLRARRPAQVDGSASKQSALEIDVDLIIPKSEFQNHEQRITESARSIDPQVRIVKDDDPVHVTTSAVLSGSYGDLDISFFAWRAEQIAGTGPPSPIEYLMPSVVTQQLAELGDLTVVDAIKQVKERSRTTKQDVSLFGVSFSYDRAMVAAPLFTIGLMLYLLAYVNHLRRSHQRPSEPASPIWIGVLPDRLSTYVTTASVVLLPLAANIWLLLRGSSDVGNGWWIFGAILTLALALLGFRVARSIGQLRRLIHVPG